MVIKGSMVFFKSYTPLINRSYEKYGSSICILDPLLLSFALNGKSCFLTKAFSSSTVCTMHINYNLELHLHEILAFLKFDLCVICSQCDHGSGARDTVAKKEYRKQAVKATDPKESDYKTAYGTKQGYVAAYSTKHDVKDSGYAATYGTKHDVDESGYAAGYEAAYQTKQDAKDSYNTAYGTKEDSKEHVSVRFMIITLYLSIYIGEILFIKLLHNYYTTQMT